MRQRNSLTTPTKLFLVLILIFGASCSRSKLVSISEHRLDLPTRPDYLQLVTRSANWGFGEGNSTASGFIKNFAIYAESSLPFPVVIWAAEGDRQISSFEYPASQTYAEALRRIGTRAGPYQTRLYPGFIEIVWADANNEKKIRDSIKRSVPPIVFHSRNAADFLRMWHAVSGMEFRYDPMLFFMNKG